MSLLKKKMSDQCFSNETYNDFGAGYECGDNYSSLEGGQTCGVYGSSIYARGGMLNGKSYCSQSSDYAGAQNMYAGTTTEIPDIDQLNFFPGETVLNNQHYYNPFVQADGSYVYPKLRPGVLYSPIMEKKMIAAGEIYKNAIDNITKGDEKVTDAYAQARGFGVAPLTAAKPEGFYYQQPNYQEKYATPADFLNKKLRK